MVNILQFIVYYHLIKISLAPHSSEFLIQLKVIALGEFIPYDEIKIKVKKILGVEDDQSFTESGLLDDLGTTWLVAAGLLLLTLLLLLLGLLKKKLNDKLKMVIEKVKAKLFWNAFIRYTLQTYLKIGFVCIPALAILSTKGATQKISIFANVALLLILPGLYAAILYKKREKMLEEAT